MQSPVISRKFLVICHLYYNDIAISVLESLLPLNTPDTTFLFNLQQTPENKENIYRYIKETFLHKIIISLPNTGRDIGGKLRLLNIAIELGIHSDYTLIIHDKKSPHINHGLAWGAELMKIIRKKAIPQIEDLFLKDESIGIICSSDYIQNEYSEIDNSFLCTSNPILQKIVKEYDLRITNYDFVAGNIFWIRSRVLNAFFKTKIPIWKVIASLEKGNAVDFNSGTHIHSWERISSWIANIEGHRIYGI